MKKMLGSKIFKGSEQGVGLLEVLISLSIFAAVGVVFLMGLQTSGKAVIISQKNVTAESLAKSKMEEAKGQAYVAGATTYTVTAIPTDLSDQGYDVLPVDVALPPGHATDDGIQRITVTVKYRGDAVFILEDYKVDR